MASTAEVCELAREAVHVFQSMDDVSMLHRIKSAISETKDAWISKENDARIFFRGGLQCEHFIHC